MIFHSTEEEKKDIIKFLYINGLQDYSFIDEPNLEIGDIIQLKPRHLIIGEANDIYITISARYDVSKGSYTFDYPQELPIPKNSK